MHVRELDVVSIHPDPGNPPGLDLKEILAALAPKLGEWSWCVRGLDWLGPDGEPTCRAVELAGVGGLWLDSEALVERASTIYQTIEGIFLAFPRAIDRRRLNPADLDLSAFPESPASLAIVAIDGGSFDIYAKDRDVPALLHAALANVRDEDAGRYF